MHRKRNNCYRSVLSSQIWLYLMDLVFAVFLKFHHVNLHKCTCNMVGHLQLFLKCFMYDVCQWGLTESLFDLRVGSITNDYAIGRFCHDYNYQHFKCTRQFCLVAHAWQLLNALDWLSVNKAYYLSPQKPITTIFNQWDVIYAAQKIGSDFKNETATNSQYSECNK